MIDLKWSLRPLAVSALLLGLPLAASAQSLADAAQRTPPPQGPMRVEPIENGFTIAPEFKVANVDHYWTQLAGVSGGFVYDKTLEFGAAGYWQVNDHNHQGYGGQNLAYGGFLFKWLGRGNEYAGYSLGALVGGGEARLFDTILVQAPGAQPKNGIINQPIGAQNVLVGVESGFFVFEPQAEANFMFSRHVRIGLGASYRLAATGYHDYYYGYTVTDFSHRLSGASGTISVQFFTAPIRKQP